MSVVKQDETGIFIQLNGAKYRPGNINGYSHAFKMDDGGLKKGDTVKASHRAGTPTIKITLDDGIRIWANDYVHNLEK